MHSRWTAGAERKRAKEIARLEALNPRAALKALDEMDWQVSLIEANPHMGIPLPGSPNHYLWPFQNTSYSVFYRVRPRKYLIEFHLFIHNRENH